MCWFRPTSLESLAEFHNQIEVFGGLSGRSLRRTLRVQVVAGDARASSPRAPCRLARVSMKPRCRLHEPIRFINCSTSSFYSSIFIQIRGICVPIRKRKISLERGAGSLLKRKQSQKTRSSLLRLSVSSALARIFFFSCGVCFSACILSPPRFPPG